MRLSEKCPYDHLLPHVVIHLSSITSVADLKTDKNRSGFEFVRPDGRKGRSDSSSNFSVSIDTKHKKRKPGVASGMGTLRSGYFSTPEAAAKFLVTCIMAWKREDTPPLDVPIVHVQIDDDASIDSLSVVDVQPLNDGVVERAAFAYTRTLGPDGLAEKTSCLKANYKRKRSTNNVQGAVLTEALPHEAIDSEVSAHERIRDVCAKILRKDMYHASTDSSVPIS